MREVFYREMRHVVLVHREIRALYSCTKYLSNLIYEPPGTKRNEYGMSPRVTVISDMCKEARVETTSILLEISCRLFTGSRHTSLALVWLAKMRTKLE